MPRGGARQGTPGKGYSNRTDLSTDFAPQQGTTTAAAGGQTMPPGSEQTYTTPDQVPKLDDPTARPGEPVTSGLMTGPGPGPEALGGVPSDPSMTDLRAAYLNSPSPSLSRALHLMAIKNGQL